MPPLGSIDFQILLCLENNLNHLDLFRPVHLHVCLRWAVLSSLTLISLTLRSPDSKKFCILVSEAFETARRFMSCVLRVESISGLVLRFEGSQQLTRSMVQ